MLVGLCGWEGCGKTTAANYLIDEMNFVEVSFADTLKEVCAILFDYPLDILRGKTPEARAEREIRKDEIWGMTGREILEQIGTDVFRTHFDDNIWIKIAQRRIVKLLSEGRNVVISDIRFPNEYQFVKDLKGEVVHIIRDRSKKKLTEDLKHFHPSKWSHLLFCNADCYQIYNVKSIHHLYDNLDHIIGILQENSV
jgi:hypothetical protein